MATDSNPDYDVFCANMRRVRKEKGLTQTELAIKCGMAQPHISDIEGGKREPSISNAKKIAAALGIKLDDLTESSAAAVA